MTESPVGGTLTASIKIPKRSPAAVIRAITIPMACASALSMFLSAIFSFLTYRLSRLGEKPSRLYPLFAFLGLANGVFLGAFCLVVNASGDDLVRNVANRALVVAASLIFPISAHFYASYFGIGKTKALKQFDGVLMAALGFRLRAK